MASEAFERALDAGEFGPVQRIVVRAIALRFFRAALVEARRRYDAECTTEELESIDDGELDPGTMHGVVHTMLAELDDGGT